ncbi:MAG: hypothetical protein D6681_05730 [Calditrichaeota bacterium]|nr:MAG: hypothetical protein D6681_05730 [Calditrichota bacterium]
MHVKPSENPDLVGKVESRQTLVRYWDRFDEMLSNPPEPVDIEDLTNAFSVKAATVRKHLRRYIHHFPERLTQIVGFYPDAETILDLAERQSGSLTRADNLLAINRASKRIVDAITKPRHERFLRMKFSSFMKGDEVCAPVSELIDLLYDDYTDFVHEADNALVSIAGRLNEEILMRGLESGGLVRDADFIRSGNNSEADILIHQSGGHRRTLFCEVKSYHARERFLRGLKDIPYREKVGVGFFRDASEFNPERTKTILTAQPMAVYLPEDTLGALHPDSRTSTTAEQNRLYRPLSSFVPDAVFFRDHGRLPPFKGN